MGFPHTLSEPLSPAGSEMTPLSYAIPLTSRPSPPKKKRMLAEMLRLTLANLQFCFWKSALLFPFSFVFFFERGRLGCAVDSSSSFPFVLLWIFPGLGPLKAHPLQAESLIHSTRGSMAIPTLPTTRAVSAEKHQMACMDMHVK